MKAEHRNITREKILEAIRYGQDLFNYLATDTHHGDNLIDIFKISRKQYYTMLQKLRSADLIKRKSGSYLLTPFGTVIYGVQLEFGKALHDHLKIKITDAEKVKNAKLKSLIIS